MPKLHFDLARLRFIGAGLAAFGLGALVGGWVVLRNPTNGLGRVINEALGQPAGIDYSEYWDVYHRLETKYAGSIDRKQLLYGAIRGTVAALGDPYSLFLDPQETARFFEDLNGQFSGIGAEINQEGDKFVIISPLPGSPAEAAGLKAHDEIVSVDGKDARQFKFGELINAIRGQAGTDVKLSIIRRGNDKPTEITVKRDTIRVKSVTLTKRDDGIDVVQITEFGDDTVKEMTDAAKTITADHPKGIILDLRNNPGGFLNSAVDISSLFIRDKVIVYEQDKSGHRDELDRTLDPILADYRLVVLVNEGSASASEITAGAIQDHKQGKIVGTTTFGKGSVQEVEKLPDGSALRLTVAKWLTPNGREINHQGITPDVEVKQDTSTPADEPLDKAVELLKK